MAARFRWSVFAAVSAAEAAAVTFVRTVAGRTVPAGWYIDGFAAVATRLVAGLVAGLVARLVAWLVAGLDVAAVAAAMAVVVVVSGTNCRLGYHIVADDAATQCFLSKIDLTIAVYREENETSANDVVFAR